MKIARVLNNNAVLVEEAGHQYLVTGLSIGFHKKAGAELDEHNAEHQYLLTDKAGFEAFGHVYESIPEPYMELTTQIVEIANRRLHCEFSGNALIGLADHIYSSVDRLRKGIVFDEAMTFDVRQYYPLEYQAACQAVELIEQKFGVKMNGEEAGFIAFHFIEAELELSNGLTEIKSMTRIINDALKIVGDYFGHGYDTSSTAYSRFIVHLRYLAQRVVKKERAKDDDDSELLAMIKAKYAREYGCAEQVAAYLRDNFDFNPRGFEIMYLAIHIAKIERDGKE